MRKIVFPESQNDAHSSPRVLGREQVCTCFDCCMQRRKPLGNRWNDAPAYTPATYWWQEQLPRGCTPVRCESSAMAETRATQCRARSRAGHHAIGKNQLAIYNYVTDADRVLVRVFVRCLVGNCVWIKDYDIGKIVFLEKATTIETEIRRRQTADYARV